MSAPETEAEGTLPVSRTTTLGKEQERRLRLDCQGSKHVGCLFVCERGGKTESKGAMRVTPTSAVTREGAWCPDSVPTTSPTRRPSSSDEEEGQSPKAHTASDLNQHCQWGPAG